MPGLPSTSSTIAIAATMLKCQAENPNARPVAAIAIASTHKGIKRATGLRKIIEKRG